MHLNDTSPRTFTFAARPINCGVNILCLFAILNSGAVARLKSIFIPTRFGNCHEIK